MSEQRHDEAREFRANDRRLEIWAFSLLLTAGLGAVGCTGALDQQNGGEGATPVTPSGDVEPDPKNETFLANGKADGINPTERERKAVLQFVNEASESTLDEDAELYEPAAANIVEHRNGPDGELGTDDDDPIDDLEELDSIAWVGVGMYKRLRDYALSHGYPDADDSDDSDSGDGNSGDANHFGATDREKKATLQFVNEATLETLDDEVPLHALAAENIVEHRNGADGELGTDDDNLFDDLRELDGVTWVGAGRYEKIRDYALANGYPTSDDSQTDPVDSFRTGSDRPDEIFDLDVASDGSIIVGVRTNGHFAGALNDNIGVERPVVAKFRPDGEVDWVTYFKDEVRYHPMVEVEAVGTSVAVLHDGGGKRLAYLDASGTQKWESQDLDTIDEFGILEAEGDQIVATDTSGDISWVHQGRSIAFGLDGQRSWAYNHQNSWYAVEDVELGPNGGLHAVERGPNNTYLTAAQSGNETQAWRKGLESQLAGSDSADGYADYRVDVDADGQIFVVRNQVLAKFGADGGLHWTHSLPLAGEPRYLEVRGDSAYVVADDLGDVRIARVEDEQTSGRLVANEPVDLEGFASGNDLWVASARPAGDDAVYFGWGHDSVSIRRVSLP